MLLATLLAGCDAFCASTLYATSTAGRAVSPTMKHNDFYERLSRAESGRMRLCVVRSGPHQILARGCAPRCAAAPELSGTLTSLRPVSSLRTNNHIYAQVVDDAKGHVLVAASTIEKGNRKDYGGNCEGASEVGKRIAERAKAKGIEQVYFDRHGNKYHGRVAALADAAREGGLSF